MEDLEVKEGSKVKDIIDYYKVKSEYIAVARINKKIVSEDTEVKENDFVEIFPIFGGG